MPKQEKPIISVTSPWGAETDTEALQAGRDQFYVAGYSDKREEFDAAIRDSETPTVLSHRFQYVSVQKADGSQTRAKEAYYRSRGYIPVLYDEAASFGIDATKSGFIKDADGTCRVGSQMLMVCPAAKVAAHARDLADKNEALSQAFKGRAEQAAEEYNRAHPGYAKTSFEFDERNDDTPFEFEKKMRKP